MQDTSYIVKSLPRLYPISSIFHQQMMRLNFDAIKDLHNGANDLLRSPITQQFLTCSGEGKWVQEVSEASLRMLDAC